MNQYVPVFPRSVSGGDYRMPLDHPCCEKIGARADRVYREAPLAESERVRLLKYYGMLQEADERAVDFFLHAPLPETDFRPLVWNVGRFNARDTLLTQGINEKRHPAWLAGWVWRVSEWVAKVELKYGIAEGGGDVGDDI
ncbi:hypothetical protein [Hyphomicrobium sp. CS1BSMeth3]|uniref:hypothetical protein n=1 Tax=Hyphomicrobium sp. CS1BSMeth3 TaxID=1892844 RepID=UPI00116087FA|nr:hypothetical protein [Hyphomicrobium sp. CS1BSMeth3]